MLICNGLDRLRWNFLWHLFWSHSGDCDRTSLTSQGLGWLCGCRDGALSVFVCVGLGWGGGEFGRDREGGGQRAATYVSVLMKICDQLGLPWQLKCLIKSQIGVLCNARRKQLWQPRWDYVSGIKVRCGSFTVHFGLMTQ